MLQRSLEKIERPKGIEKYIDMKHMTTKPGVKPPGIMTAAKDANYRRGLPRPIKAFLKKILLRDEGIKGEMNAAITEAFNADQIFREEFFYMIPKEVQYLIVGAGIHGLSTAWRIAEHLISNGETVVLGGVYTSSDRKTVDRIPFFSDLPYVGFLFKRTDVDKKKDELLIFITPKILKDTLKIN